MASASRHVGQIHDSSELRLLYTESIDEFFGFDVFDGESYAISFRRDEFTFHSNEMHEMYNFDDFRVAINLRFGLRGTSEKWREIKCGKMFAGCSKRFL